MHLAMDSSEKFSLNLRRNPRRNCRISPEDSAEFNFVSGDKASVLHTNALLHDLNLAESYGQCSTGDNKDKQETRNGICLEISSKKEPEGLVPLIKPHHTLTTLRMKRKRKNNKPTKKKADARKAASDGFDTSLSSPNIKGTRLRQSKRSQSRQTTPDFSTVTQNQELFPCHANRKLTPKRSGIRSIPLLSSTPKYNRQSLSPEKSEDSVRHPNSSKTPPTGSTTSRPLRARIRSKQNVQESPSTSQPVKRRRKTTLVPVESPQEEPSEESQTPCETSSDLSIELSQREATLSLFLEEEEEDEEELPSFLWQEIKRPLSFTEGLCVWCKLRKYPYWPAVIKSVNQKSKKASIVFIDTFLNDQKRTIKGISVSLRNLKHFDCEEFSNLVELAKEKYGSSITWSLDLISDYQIRLGCGSFSGTFIDFYAADISLPVRKNLSEGKSLLTFPGQEILAELSDVQTEDVVEEKHHEVLSKKILPDRTKAARTHANKKLVDFIIKKKVERHLLGILSGRESSKWMQAFLKPFQREACPVYLEDEEQVDQVFQYLDKLCKNSENSCADLLQGDRIRLILDVLLPEAIVYAIAGVHNLSLERAEEKYRRGPCFSNRERQEFDMMIEEQMKLKQIPPPQS